MRRGAPPQAGCDTNVPEMGAVVQVAPLWRPQAPECPTALWALSHACLTLSVMTDGDRPKPHPPHPPSQAQSRERMCIYVDGFNLYHGLHDAYGRKWLWLDLVKLAQTLRPKNDIVRVKYFTADVVNESDAASRQATYINALTARYPAVFEVIRGHYKSKTKTCRSCGSTWQHHEEKETDVNIALHVLKDALDGACESALVVSADSDLGPAVKMVRDAKPDYFIAAAFPPNRYSADLHHLMPSSFHINKNKVRTSQLPPTVVGRAPDKTYSRPPKW